LVAEDDPELKKLTDQFVRVRVVQMGGVDLATFQFDPMLSWAVFFMNADKTIYGRYGRAHPSTKRNRADSNPNPTIESLREATSRALEFHKDYVQGKRLNTFEAKTGPMPRWRFAEKTPAAKKYGRLQRVKKDDHNCVHCHEVLRTAIDSHFMTKKRVPDNMLWLYPRPHVLGLAFSNRHATRITRVTPGSPAADAGLQVGDDLRILHGQPLLSVADVQWVLHAFPDEGGALPCVVARESGIYAVPLTLVKDWRRAEDFGWRYRMAGYAAWLWAGVSVQDHKDGIRVSQKAPGWFKRENKDAKRALRVGDIITSVDGTRGMDRSALLAYLMRDKKLGSKVKLEVLREGESVKVEFEIPKKQPEVQGH
jgi:hypothetical protein